MKIKVKAIVENKSERDICTINVEYAQQCGCLDDEGLPLG